MLQARLEEITSRLEEVVAQMGDSGIVSDHGRYRALASEHRQLTPVVETWAAVQQKRQALFDARGLLTESDPELRAMARDEIQVLEPELAALEAKLQVLLLPRDPSDSKGVILEIRAGTGGDEAALFAADVFRMYGRYAELKGWTVEVLSENENDLGGFKEIVASFTGDEVYGRLKFESGVHRVQRVPTTEAQGRIHTSACTVAILPEADEIEVDINESDLKIDTYRASGAGGQHVNKTESAIRITHIPTGVIVACQDERSQVKNKAKAMKVLRAKLLEAKETKANSERAADRKSQVGTGDRSERIRTYNFPQNRLTDHRIGLTLYKLEAVMMGELDSVIEPLLQTRQAELLNPDAAT
jgi:peptide chain release factor 1